MMIYVSDFPAQFNPLSTERTELLVKILNKILDEMPFGEDFWRLKNVKGQRKYHQEGNAFEHTLLVCANAVNFGFLSKFFLRLCLFHDVGKIYTGIPKVNGDWEYPDHSTIGGMKSILRRFIPANDPFFEETLWCIRHHIRPMFWSDKQEELCKADCPNNYESAKVTLFSLVLCDLYGSHGDDDNCELKKKIIEVVDPLEGSL